MEYNYIEKNNKQLKVGVYTFHFNNCDRKIIEYQKKVFDVLGIKLNQLTNYKSHGDFMTEISRSEQVDYLVFFDIDAIPLCPDILKKLIDRIFEKQTILGIEQNSNRGGYSKQCYAGPACFAISKDFYQLIGMPSYVETPRSDVAEELSYICREKGFPVAYIQFSKCKTPIWRLDDSGRKFGYASEYEGLVFHNFQGRMSSQIHYFYDKCEEVISLYKNKDTKMDLSICLTVKNRSYFTIGKEDFTEPEVRGFTQQETFLKKVLGEESYKEFSIKDRIKQPYTLFKDCIKSIRSCCLRNLSFNIEVVVADFGSTDINVQEFLERTIHDGLDENIDFKYINLGDIPFNRGLGTNRAVQEATSSNILIIDADILIGLDYFDKVIDILHITDMTNTIHFPMCFRYTDPAHYAGFFEAAGYGMILCKKEDYYKIGKMPEYPQWGKEDTDIFLKAKEMGYNIVRKPYIDLVHQWHPYNPQFRNKYAKKEL